MKRRMNQIRAQMRSDQAWTACMLCDKRAYRSEGAARNAIKGSGKRAGTRVYRCGPGWHVTSSPKAETRANRGARNKDRRRSTDDD